MPHLETNFILTVVVVLLSIGLILAYSLGNKKRDVHLADQLLAQAHAEKRHGAPENVEYMLSRAQKIYELAGIPDITKYSSCMVMLMERYTQVGKFDAARDACRLMLNAWQQVLKEGNQDRMIDIDYFAATATFGSGIQDVAEFYKSVIELKKQTFGPSHSEVINSMLLYSRLLTQTGARAEAEQVAAEAQAMRDNPQAAQEPQAPPIIEEQA